MIRGMHSLFSFLKASRAQPQPGPLVSSAHTTHPSESLLFPNIETANDDGCEEPTNGPMVILRSSTNQVQVFNIINSIPIIYQFLKVSELKNLLITNKNHYYLINSRAAKRIIEQLETELTKTPLGKFYLQIPIPLREEHELQDNKLCLHPEFIQIKNYLLSKNFTLVEIINKVESFLAPHNHKGPLFKSNYIPECFSAAVFFADVSYAVISSLRWSDIPWPEPSFEHLFTQTGFISSLLIAYYSTFWSTSFPMYAFFNRILESPISSSDYDAHLSTDHAHQSVIAHAYFAVFNAAYAVVSFVNNSSSSSLLYLNILSELALLFQFISSTEHKKNIEHLDAINKTFLQEVNVFINNFHTQYQSFFETLSNKDRIQFNKQIDALRRFMREIPRLRPDIIPRGANLA